MNIGNRIKQIQIKIIYFYSKYGVVKHEEWNKVRISNIIVCFQNDICAAYLFQHCKSYMIHMIANNQMNSILLPADNQQELHYKC